MQLMHAAGVGRSDDGPEAMILLSVALSPPLTLLPPRSVPVDLTQGRISEAQTIETWGQLSPTRLEPPSAVTAMPATRAPLLAAMQTVVPCAKEDIARRQAPMDEGGQWWNKLDYCLTRFREFKSK
jgi:hypothetical protein